MRLLKTGTVVFHALFPAGMKNKTSALSGGKCSVKNDSSCDATNRRNSKTDAISAPAGNAA